MARASKTPQRPAPAAPAAAKPASAKPAARPAAPAAAPALAPGNSLRMTLLILLLAVITGAAPLALAGQALGYWTIPIAPPSLPFLSTAPVYDPPLARPQSLVANATVMVVATPGDGGAVATLEPGFPVSVTRYASQGGARWAQVHWAGPVKAAGGSGWALAAHLTAPGAHDARPIGDLGALAPAVGQAASAAGAGFAATLYFPGAGYAYHSASASQTVTLGQQMITITLVADFGEGLAARQPGSIPHDVAAGNPQALTFLYNALGGANGLRDYLAHYQISGFHFASDPTQSTATVQGLGQFYAAIAQAPLVGPDDQRQIFTLLSGASANTAAYASASQIGSGALTITTEQTAKGYTTIVAGQLQPASGPAMILVAVSADQPSAAKSQAALQAFLKPLFTTLG